MPALVAADRFDHVPDCSRGCRGAALAQVGEDRVPCPLGIARQWIARSTGHCRALPTGLDLSIGFATKGVPNGRAVRHEAFLGWADELVDVVLAHDAVVLQ